ncbi:MULTISPECIES: hypothetical protein [Clostridium]|nr:MULTISPECIES: hypothetical protein [Clostridium]MBC2464748.1 hypothetical protein [Clostridium saccharobutylicum]NOW25522.1 chromosome segregation ATPase [Clostridium butyricum]
MMAEKVTSMRLNEEDLEQFKSFAKDNGLNQQQAFNSLIALAELEKAKNVLGDRGKEIETFRDTVNKLLNFYINSLEVNTTTEQTIREELSKELNRKDNTISNLYEQLQEMKTEKLNSDATIQQLEEKNNGILEQLQKANTDVAEKSKSIEKLNSNNDLLQEQLQEYKAYKNNYKALEEHLYKLKADNANKDTAINTLENNNQQLQDKIKNDTEMIEFYKSNNIELKGNIKAIESQFKQDIQTLKEEHTKALAGQIEAIKEQLESKYNLELEKKSLEIQKLNNTIEQLKSVKPKQQHKPKTTKSEE